MSKLNYRRLDNFPRSGGNLEVPRTAVTRIVLLAKLKKLKLDAAQRRAVRS